MKLVSVSRPITPPSPDVLVSFHPFHVELLSWSGYQLRLPLGRQEWGDVPWISKKVISSVVSKSSIRLKDSCKFIFPSLCLPFWDIERPIPPHYTSSPLIYHKKVCSFSIFLFCRLSNRSSRSSLKIPYGSVIRTGCSPLLPPKNVVEMKWRAPFTASCIVFNQHINIVWTGKQKLCCGIGWWDQALMLMLGLSKITPMLSPVSIK
jgi:hypothetical protein